VADTKHTCSLEYLLKGNCGKMVWEFVRSFCRVYCCLVSLLPFLIWTAKGYSLLARWTQIETNVWNADILRCWNCREQDWRVDRHESTT
jgi:hypothetical protein